MRRRRPEPVITLADIAKASGFSRHTVGFVLNGTKVFPPATRDAVLAAAKRLGYRPNASARAVRSGRFNAVGLLTDLEGNRTLLSPQLLRGVVDALDEVGHHLVFARFPEDRSRRLSSRALTDLLVDGLLINYHAEQPPGMRTWLAACGMPYVQVNRRNGTDTVRPDDVGGARALTDLLRKRGHRHIAYIDRYYDGHQSKTRHFSVDARLQGYRKAMDAAGLERIEILDDVTYARPGQSLLDAILTPPRRCTAAICYSDHDLFSLANMAKGRGLRLPQDLFLAGIGDFEKLRIESVGMMFIDWYDIGKTAVDMLMRRMHGAAPQPCRLIPCIPQMPPP